MIKFLKKYRKGFGIGTTFSVMYIVMMMTLNIAGGEIINYHESREHLIEHELEKVFMEQYVKSENGEKIELINHYEFIENIDSIMEEHYE